MPRTIMIAQLQLLVSEAPDRNDVPSKVRYLLGYIARKSQFPGERIVLNCETDYPVCFAAKLDEFTFYVVCEEGGFLDKAGEQ